MSGSSEVEDSIGDRSRLIQIGMGAVLVACVVFALVRLVTERLTGLATPW